MIPSRCGFFLVVVLTIAFLPGIVPTAGAVDGQGDDQVVNATVCRLVREPGRFRGKTVRVKALVESDLIEHTMLSDESCQSYGISLWIPHDLDDNADVIALRSVLKEQWKPRAPKTQVSGVFTGTFSVEGKKRFLKVSKIEERRVSGG